MNDYGEAARRLLLAPYDHREAGLSQYLDGIVPNPMDQETASQIAEFGVPHFPWNDAAYSAEPSWPQALARIAGGDPESTATLTVFADLEHYGPSSAPQPWQRQAPVLAGKTAAFRQRWNAGDHSAPDDPKTYAEQIRDVPSVIRDGKVDSAFVTDCGPWLDAIAL